MGIPKNRGPCLGVSTLSILAFIGAPTFGNPLAGRMGLRKFGAPYSTPVRIWTPKRRP